MKVNEAVYIPLKRDKPIHVHQGGTSCFAPDTRVMTKEGTKRIDQVSRGDYILSYNGSTKEKEYKKAVNVLRFDNHKKTIRVKLKNGEEIVATEDHEFYYEGGWHSLKHILSLREQIIKENNMETWKQIPNFSRYEASTKGRLRSTNYKNSGKTKVLKPALSADKYLKTMLQNDGGKYKSWAVHKWVALAFLGKKPKGMEINHLDGVKTNNAPDNLEYCTKSENMIHAYDNDLMERKRGSKNGMAKLTEEKVISIRKHAKENGRYYGRKELADKHGVSEAQIKDIVNRRRDIWPHV